ncbi:MAG: PLP-dependent aminotransferase family protein [Firmicutes bacterium]|jgi:2-aminoadipate transaminase|nr:PLP-dependent aminotransferase family protein [Bacillota bacterium]
MEWEKLFAPAAQVDSGSGIIEILRLSEEPGVISLAGGFPAAEMFSLTEVREIADRILATKGEVALQYGPTPGFTPLREYLSERMKKSFAAQVAPEEIVITSGALQGLDLICRVLLTPGDIVITEAPTYVGALQTFSGFGAQVEEIPTDDEGMQVDLLAERLQELEKRGAQPKFIYVIPSFQNPGGTTLSTVRRRLLVDLAASYGVPIVEDSAYAELRFAGSSKPSLKSLDSGEGVVFLGTFSKILSPGLRLGWVAAPPALAEKIISAKQTNDQCSSSLSQYLALECGRQGIIDRQIENSKEILKKRAAALVAGLAQYFPQGTHWVEPEGGFFTWVTLPPTQGLDTGQLLRRAVVEEKVAYVAGCSFYAHGQGSNQLRLCFSYPPLENILLGTERLGKFFSAFYR